MSDTILAALRSSRVVPVVSVSDAREIDTIADGLTGGGIGCIEVTLRTAAGLEAIRRIATRADIIVGAGTVLTSEQVAEAVAAGAKFVVSPGYDARVVDAVRDANLLAIPGIATPTELQQARAAGLRTVKVFPAVALGGVPYLDALHQPFPDMTFLPSGGIKLATAAQFLAHPAVVALGASWLVPGPDELWDDLRAAVLARARATTRAVVEADRR